MLEKIIKNLQKGVIGAALFMGLGCGATNIVSEPVKYEYLDKEMNWGYCLTDTEGNSEYDKKHPCNKIIKAHNQEENIKIRYFTPKGWKRCKDDLIDYDNEHPCSRGFRYSYVNSKGQWKHCTNFLEEYSENNPCYVVITTYDQREAEADAKAKAAEETREERTPGFRDGW
jgi:hypothetical protein